MIFIAIIITINQPTYRVDESNGLVQPVLVLSNPSSTDINIRVKDNSDTATGE